MKNFFLSLLLALTFYSTPAVSQHAGDGKQTTKVYTVATLPACAIGNVGSRQPVSDDNRADRVCRLTTGSTYSWVAVTPEFNVLNFGAVPDAAATSDSTAIQAAIDAATPGSTVFLPPATTIGGYYYIPTSIKVKSGITIRGSGASEFTSAVYGGSTPLKSTGAIWVFENPNPASSDAIQNFKLRDISVDLSGNSAALGVFDWADISSSLVDSVGILFYDAPSARQYGFKIRTQVAGAYYSTFRDVNAYAQTPGSLITVFAISAGANENKVYGGHCARCDKPVTVSASNGNNFFGFAADGGQNVSYSFDTSAGNNRVWGGRSEHYPLNISSVSRASNVVTVTLSSAARLFVGQYVYLYGVTDSTFNGASSSSAAITSVADTTHFTFAQTGADATSSGGYVVNGSVASFDATSKGNAIVFPNAATYARFAVKGNSENTILQADPDGLSFGVGATNSTEKDLYTAALTTAANTFSNAIAGQLIQGYTAVDAANANNANGELLLGNGASSRFRIAYNGANSGFAYLDTTTNSTTEGLRIRNRTSGTPLIAATFVNGTTVISKLHFTNLAFSSTAPTVTSAGTSPSIAANNGTAAFTVNVGTGGTAHTIVLALPAATTGWICDANNLTGSLANRADQAIRQTAATTTSATLQNQTISTGAALAFTASDTVQCKCVAY